MCKTLLIFLWGHFMFSMEATAQKRGRISLEDWKKAVVNLEMESGQHSQDYIDFITDSLSRAGYPAKKIDTIKYVLEHSTIIFTGTAIYIRDHNRKYLVSVMHTLFDDTLSNAKANRIARGNVHYESNTAITPRISIRTPFSYYLEHDRRVFNNNALIINNFTEGPSLYRLVPDSTGDGIAIISLQPDTCKWMVDTLQHNGYEPLSLEDIMPERRDREISELDTVFAIGFPERISIVERARWPFPYEVYPPHQTMEIVAPFIVEGKIAMYNPGIQHFYVNITAYSGNSGSPIINRNGKFIGLISSANAGNVYDKNANLMDIHGVGQLITVVNTRWLPDILKKFKPDEERYINEEAKKKKASGGAQATYFSSGSPQAAPAH